MSFKLMAQAIDLQVGNATRKLVLLKLADQANDDGVCYPSVATIMRACEIKSDTTVRNHIKALVKMGLVRVEHRWNAEKQCNYSNIYRLTLDSSVQKLNNKNDVPQKLKGGGSKIKEGTPIIEGGGTPIIEGGTPNIDPEPITEPTSIEPITEPMSAYTQPQASISKNSRAVKKSKSMVKPTLEQVTEYFTERNHPSPKNEAERWLDYYTANGWRVGKNPMKDWKATVRYWMRNDNHNPPQATTQSTQDIDWQAVGRAGKPVGGYHPSHSQPTQQAKPNPKISVMVNGLWKSPLPNMSVAETYEYIKRYKDVGETDDEAYDRLFSELKRAS